jgi:hypothetical protein
VIPTCLVGGVLLWRHKALGYVAGAGLVLQYSLLFIGLLPVMVFPALHSASTIDGAGIALMIACGSICLVLLALFVRGALSDRSPRSIPGGDVRP